MFHQQYFVRSYLDSAAMKRNKLFLWGTCMSTAIATHVAAVYILFGDNATNTPHKIGQKGVILELSFEGRAQGGHAQKGNVQEIVENKPQKPQKKPQKKPTKPQEKPPEKTQVKKNIPEKKNVVTKKIPEPAVAPPEPQKEHQEETPAPPPPNMTNSLAGAGGTKFHAKGNKGDGNAAQSGGDGGIIETYEDLIQVWIQKNLVYPRTAQKRRLQGIVMVRFTLDETGRLKYSEITEPGPYRILNRSALKTLKKAQPFPAFFPEMKLSEKTFVIPIEYYMAH